MRNLDQSKGYTYVKTSGWNNYCDFIMVHEAREWIIVAIAEHEDLDFLLRIFLLEKDNNK